MNNKIQHCISCLCLMAGLLMALPTFAKYIIVDFDENFDRNTPVYGVALCKPEQNSAKKPNRVYFSYYEKHSGSDGLSEYMPVEVNAKDLTVKREHMVPVKFEDMQEIDNGWRIFWFKGLPGNIKQWYILKSDKDYPQNLGLIVDDQDGKPFRIEYSKRGNVVKPDFTTPEAADYTLINTKKLIGNKEAIYEYNCDIFAEGVVRVNFGDGDFAVYPDNMFTKDVKALYPEDYRAKDPIGDLQLTNNGQIIKKENGEVSLTYPNGLKEVYGELHTEWKMAYADSHEKPHVYLSKPVLLIDPSKSEPMKWVRITRVDDKYPQLYKGMGSEGYLYGDRLYKINNDYQLVPVVQIVDDIPLPIACTDTIVSVEKNLTTKKRDNSMATEYQEYDLKINYKNGDYIQTSGADIIAGSIHRNGGVLTFKKVNDKLITTLTFPNGDKYVGTFAEYNIDNDYRYKPYLAFQLSELSLSDIVFKDGTLIKQDGSTLEYIGGKNEQQIAEERKAKAEREKAADAMATAEYNKLCQQYGKKYVDAAYGLYQPLVGMPEGLLKKALNLKLVETGNNYTLYRVIGWGVNHFGSNLTNAAILYSVWVSNGKVTHVKKW